MTNMTLTNAQKYNPFFISGVQEKLLSYCDAKDILSLKCTNKDFNKIEENYTYFLFLCRESNISEYLMNLIREEYLDVSVWNEIDLAIEKNRRKFKKYIYETLFMKMIYKNIYKPYYTVFIWDIILDNHDRYGLFYSKEDSISFIINILNKNIDKIKETNKIKLWSSFIGLGCGDKGKFNNELQVYYLEEQ